MPCVPVPDTPDLRPEPAGSSEGTGLFPLAALFAPAGTSVPPHVLSQRDNRIIGIRIKADTQDFQGSSAQQSPAGDIPAPSLRLSREADPEVLQAELSPRQFACGTE